MRIELELIVLLMAGLATGALMVVVVSAIVGGVVLADAFGIHTAAGQLSAFGAVCYAAVIAVGVPTCVQINNQVARWSIENPPGDWQCVHAGFVFMLSVLFFQFRHLLSTRQP